MQREARGAGGAIAVLLGAVAWGSTGTAAHFAPAGASSVSIGAARIVLGGAVLLALAARRRQRAGLAALLAAAGRPARAWCWPRSPSAATSRASSPPSG